MNLHDSAPSFQTPDQTQVDKKEYERSKQLKATDRNYSLEFKNSSNHVTLYSIPDCYSNFKQCHPYTGTQPAKPKIFKIPLGGGGCAKQMFKLKSKIFKPKSNQESAIKECCKLHSKCKSHPKNKAIPQDNHICKNLSVDMRREKLLMNEAKNTLDSNCYLIRDETSNIFDQKDQMKANDCNLQNEDSQNHITINITIHNNMSYSSITDSSLKRQKRKPKTGNLNNRKYNPVSSSYNINFL